MFLWVRDSTGSSLDHECHRIDFEFIYCFRILTELGDRRLGFARCTDRAYPRRSFSAPMHIEADKLLLSTQQYLVMPPLGSACAEGVISDASLGARPSQRNVFRSSQDLARSCRCPLLFPLWAPMGLPWTPWAPVDPRDKS